MAAEFVEDLVRLLPGVPGRRSVTGRVVDIAKGGSASPPPRSGRRHFGTRRWPSDSTPGHAGDRRAGGGGSRGCPGCSPRPAGRRSPEAAHRIKRLGQISHRRLAQRVQPGDLVKRERPAVLTDDSQQYLIGLRHRDVVPGSMYPTPTAPSSASCRPSVSIQPSWESNSGPMVRPSSTTSRDFR